MAPPPKTRHRPPFLARPPSARGLLRQPPLRSRHREDLQNGLHPLSSLFAVREAEGWASDSDRSRRRGSGGGGGGGGGGLGFGWALRGGSRGDRMGEQTSPLIPPPSEIDLEAGGAGDQLQCRICLETDGRDFIAPCKCKGTSKYVHRDCLDHWRAVKL